MEGCRVGRWGGGGGKQGVGGRGERQQQGSSRPDAWCSVSCLIQEASQRLKDMSGLKITPVARRVLLCN